jgi:Reverse transcriptase (RNA-dependent DNA polymerase)
VARGYSQIEGVNFEETFAPVTKMNSIRIVLAIAAEEDLELDHADMVTAYLNAILKEALYMYPPRDGPVGAIPVGKVLKVKRGLYGFKQSRMEWYELADFDQVENKSECKIKSETQCQTRT